MNIKNLNYNHARSSCDILAMHFETISTVLIQVTRHRRKVIDVKKRTGLMDLLFFFKSFQGIHVSGQILILKRYWILADTLNFSLPLWKVKLLPRGTFWIKVELLHNCQCPYFFFIFLNFLLMNNLFILSTFLLLNAVTRFVCCIAVNADFSGYPDIDAFENIKCNFMLINLSEKFAWKIGFFFFISKFKKLKSSSAPKSSKRLKNIWKLEHLNYLVYN